MSIWELQIDALMRLCTAEEESERMQARQEIRRMLDNQTVPKRSADPEYLTRELMLELGAPDHLVGHPYVVQAVLLVAQNRKYIDNISFMLYPRLAVIFETTPSRVERSIRNLIEFTWNRSDSEVLNRYFGNTVSADRGKPTNGEFLARLASIVSLRMQESA